MYTYHIFLLQYTKNITTSSKLEQTTGEYLEMINRIKFHIRWQDKFVIKVSQSQSDLDISKGVDQPLLLDGMIFIFVENSRSLYYNSLK